MGIYVSEINDFTANANRWSISISISRIVSLQTLATLSWNKSIKTPLITYTPLLFPSFWKSFLNIRQKKKGKKKAHLILWDTPQIVLLQRFHRMFFDRNIWIFSFLKVSRSVDLNSSQILSWAKALELEVISFECILTSPFAERNRDNKQYPPKGDYYS